MSERRADDGISDDDQKAYSDWFLAEVVARRNPDVQAAWHAATRRARAALPSAPKETP